MKTSPYQYITLKLAPLLDALSNPARLQTILPLAKYKSCQAGNISNRLPLAKSTVSEHLNKLKKAGLITCSPEANCINYQISDKGIDLLKASFLDLIMIIEQWKDKRIDCCPINQNNAGDCTG